MIAIGIEGGKGPASALAPRQLPLPCPGPGEILIKVYAAGVNRPDLLQRMGFYPPPPGAPDGLGLEASGEVVGLGAGVSRWSLGDKVTALLGGGGYAQFCTVDGRHALPVPAGLDLVQAAALPETVFTVYANVFEHGSLKRGETLLVHGATSGIGVMAIQMAKAAGARVIATARGGDKAAAAKALGADIAIDSTTQDFVAICLADGGADVVLDMVAGPFFARNLETLKTGGRLVHIATQAGANVELNIMALMQRRLVVTGSTLRPRAADEKARLAAAVEAVVWPWIAEGKIGAVVDKTFALEDAASAHAYLEAGAHIGKVMLLA
jgi:putative PIG3 family NAD(P)H quinone oxidoreductase